MEISINTMHRPHLSANGRLNLHLSGKFWPFKSYVMVVI